MTPNTHTINPNPNVDVDPDVDVDAGGDPSAAPSPRDAGGDPSAAPSPRDAGGDPSAAPSGDPTTRYVSRRGIAVIISHHRSETTLRATLHNLRTQQLTPCIVVDNSQYTPAEGNPLHNLGDDVHLITTQRQGFGSAINEALTYFNTTGATANYFMFCTHEILFLRGNVTTMLNELHTNPTTAAVGPLIVDNRNHNTIWSAGGTFTPLLKLPRHRQNQQPTHTAPTTPYHVEWMDGCCVLLRADAVQANPFDETYVFSFEETDQHLRLRRSGQHLTLTPTVHITQTTNGVAFFNLTRNFYLYRKRHYTPSHAWPGLIAMLIRQLWRERNTTPLNEFRKAINSARISLRHVTHTNH